MVHSTLFNTQEFKKVNLLKESEIGIYYSFSIFPKNSQGSLKILSILFSSVYELCLNHLSKTSVKIFKFHEFQTV